MKPETTPSSISADTTPPAQVATPAGVGIQISNVNKSLWQYIKKRKLWELLLVAPFAIIWEIVIVFLYIKYLHTTSNNNTQGGQGFGYLLAAPLVVFSSWLYKLRKQFEAAFLEEFALANKYSFDKDGTIDETYGSIFRLKGRQSVSDVVTGTYEGSSLRLFLYELVVGSGRYQQRYQDTVIELDLNGQLPNLLMVNKHSKFGQLNLTGAYGIKNTISLEGDFNQFFTLYAPQGDEIEALEVFSPDTMALMEDESKHYTVEFAGNRIYIYCNGFVATTDNLTQVFALAKKLINKIAPLANRLSKDSAIISTPVNIIKTRKSHPFARKLGVAVTVTLLLIGLGLMALAIHNAPKENSTNTSADVTPQNNASTPAATPAADPNATPYCGAIPSSTMPSATLQYLNATITLNKARATISADIAPNPNSQPSDSIINAQVTADQQFLSSLQAITYPANARADSATLQNDIKSYDSLISQEENIGTVSDASLISARSARSAASSQLRTDLGLPASTCSFYEP